MASLCNYAQLKVPQPPSILALLLAILQALGIALPDLPTVPLPAPFCPLD